MNNIFQIIQSIKNPQQAIQQLSNNSQLMKNPMIQNAITMAQNGDSKGLENLARSIGTQKGLNVDDIYNTVKTQFKL